MFAQSSTYFESSLSFCVYARINKNSTKISHIYRYFWSEAAAVPIAHEIGSQMYFTTQFMCDKFHSNKYIFHHGQQLLMYP